MAFTPVPKHLRPCNIERVQVVNHIDGKVMNKRVYERMIYEDTAGQQWCNLWGDYYLISEGSYGMNTVHTHARRAA